MNLDVSNDPEIERLGANATAQHAIRYWNTLCEAARRDGLLLDPVFSAQLQEDDEVAAEEQRTAHCTKNIVVTESLENDLKLYRRFRSNFGGLQVKNVCSTESCHPLGGQKWASLLMACDGVVSDYNLMTLLREDAHDMFWMNEQEVCDGLAIVPRAQFIFIEVGRIQEGIYDQSFRRRLMVFDLKTSSDMLSQALQNQNERQAKKALSLLRTQWPNPTKQALQESSVLKTVRCGANKGSFPEEQIQISCRELLQYWQDLMDLGRIRPTLSSKRVPSLERATRALIIQSNNNASTFPSNNKTAVSRWPTETSTTANMQDLILVSNGGSSGDDTNNNHHCFNKYGVCILPNYVKTTDLDACRNQAATCLQALIDEQLTPRGLTVDGDNAFDYAEARQRPGHRVDNRYKILDSAQPIAALGHKLSRELPRLLQVEGFKLLYGGVVHSFPFDNPNQAQPQMWHRDGPSLFAASSHHHDAHCFNVFVPMVDVSVENGTTEFIPGTHNDVAFEQVMPELLKGDKTQDKHPLAVRAEVKAGSVICFDIRVLHRGMANRSAQERPVLYFTFAKQWFLEEHFFEKEKSLLSTDNPSTNNHYTTLVARLYELVTGQKTPASPNYGHPHYTTRFDLLLLESLQAENDTKRAMQNIAAVAAFLACSNYTKHAAIREFLVLLSRNKKRKQQALKQQKKARRGQAKTQSEEADDFASISVDMSDVAALYNVTATILMKDSSLISTLGFSKDRDGVCVLIALLKAHALRRREEGVSFEEIEEGFTSWWHAGVDRFCLRSMLEQGDKERRKKLLVVVFSSLGSGIARPEWGGSLRQVAPAPGVDVLNVLDPSFSWYNQDPSCQWKGGDYYAAELTKGVKDYERVMFLGDSMGAAAAIRFSTLANEVLAFTPQVDISSYNAITRLDFPDNIRKSVKDHVVRAVMETKANIVIHYGRDCEEDAAQISLLPKAPNLQLVKHDYDDHILSLHLRGKGELKGIVEATVNKLLLDT